MIAWHMAVSRSRSLNIIIFIINLFVLLILQAIHNMSDKMCLCMGV